MPSSISCPLCLSDNCQLFHTDRARSYQQCDDCALVFVSSDFLPSSHEELQEYQLHDNNPADQGYRRFLSRLTAPLKKRLIPTATGLDFGCGPGPTLSVMMQEAGWKTAIYDPFFAKDNSVLTRQYDFITATEVIEHIHKPYDVLPMLWNMLNNGGYLALMTKLVIDQKAFAHWHYKNDRTHVCFYSTTTFNFLAKQLKADIEFIDKDVIFLRKRL